MKKLILFLMIFVAVSVSAQKQLDPNIYVLEYTGVATDTVGVGVTTWNYPVSVNKTDGLFYNMQVKVQDVTAGSAGTVKLQGKYWANDTYSDITTVTWTGVGSTDSIINYLSNTNKAYYRFYNVLVTRTAGKFKVVHVKQSYKK
jgi:choline dehydrogenase-like flavoprotein